jgi:hypothetical protein
VFSTLPCLWYRTSVFQRCRPTSLMRSTDQFLARGGGINDRDKTGISPICRCIEI